ncbi:hypothetical protein EDC04DRAFT_2605384 [Pisolithus marmoratus]|nr:hypothetical protein EDC04DRAFT_2605384 [Pisolithus marmoratus]
MADSEESAVLKWGPGLIGKYRTTVGLVLYGASIFQYLFYIFEFPNDKRLLRVVCSRHHQYYHLDKLLLSNIDLLSTANDVCLHARDALNLQGFESPPVVRLNSLLQACMGTGLFASFFVQSFYAYRVWIISNRNILLTVAVLVAALVQVDQLSGSLINLCPEPSSIVRSSASHRRHFYPFYQFDGLDHLLLIQRTWNAATISGLNAVVLHVISSSALTMAILYYQDQPSGQYLTAGPGFMLSKAYSNSMLAV